MLSFADNVRNYLLLHHIICFFHSNDNLISGWVLKNVGWNSQIGVTQRPHYQWRLDDPWTGLWNRGQVTPYSHQQGENMQTPCMEKLICLNLNPGTSLCEAIQLTTTQPWGFSNPSNPDKWLRGAEQPGKRGEGDVFPLHPFLFLFFTSNA